MSYEIFLDQVRALLPRASFSSAVMQLGGTEVQFTM